MYRVIRGHQYEDEGEDEDLPYRALISGLRERSSSHGFPQIHHAPGNRTSSNQSNLINACTPDDVMTGGLKKLVWITILMGTIGALIYNLEHIMRKFLTYDVEASVNIIRSTQQVRARSSNCDVRDVTK